MHTSKRARVELYVSSLPVIEHCKDITFGEYHPPKNSILPEVSTGVVPRPGYTQRGQSYS